MYAYWFLNISIMHMKKTHTEMIVFICSSSPESKHQIQIYLFRFSWSHVWICSSLRWDPSSRKVVNLDSCSLDNFSPFLLVGGSLVELGSRSFDHFVICSMLTRSAWCGQRAYCSLISPANYAYSLVQLDNCSLDQLACWLLIHLACCSFVQLFRC